MSDKNIHGFYPANAISNRPKTSGTPIAEVEAFIAKHGVTDLDKNPQAKPRKLQFIINGKTCVDLSEQDYSAKKKQAKAEYKTALKNLASGTAEHRITSANQAFLSTVRAIVEEKSRNGVIKNRAFAHINNQKAVRQTLSKLGYVPDSMVAPDSWRLNGCVIRDRMEDDVEFVSIQEKRLAVTRVRLLNGDFIKRPKIGTELNILLAQVNQLKDEGLNIVKVADGATRGWRLANESDIRKQMKIDALIALSREHLSADRHRVARAANKRSAYLAWLKRRRVVLITDIPESDRAHFRNIVVRCRKNGFKIETLEGKGRSALGYHLIADK